MKKDSTTRIERRLAKKKFKKENKTMLKTNKCWDELEMLHASTVGLLFSTQNITPLLRNGELISKMDSKEALRISQVISKDLIYFKEKLESVYNKHKDKKGGSENPDVLFQCIMIGQEYIEISDSFNRIVTPNIDRLLAMAAEVAGLTVDPIAGQPVEEAAVEAIEDAVIVEPAAEIKDE